MYRIVLGFLVGWWASAAYEEGQAAFTETVEKTREGALALRRRFDPMEIPEITDVF